MDKKYYLIFISLFLTSCNLAPRYSPPSIEVPSEWKAPLATEEEQPEVVFWWEVFNDTLLNELELIALANNKDLKSALYRIEEAWAKAGIDKGALFPSVSLNPAYSDTGELFKLFLPPGFSFSTSPLDVYRINMFNYQLPVIMNYELDLWGKNRNTYLSSVYEANARCDAYCTAMLSLTTELANAYFQLCSLEKQILLLDEDKNLLKKQLNLLVRRNENGLSNEIEIANTQTILANSEANYHNALRQRVLLENVIASLTGASASNFYIKGKLLDSPPPAIPPGLTTEILLNRPDIREAEKICKAQNLLIGTARASFFPTISLTGALGYVSPDFHQFLNWISRYWNMGASVTQPLFEGGILQSNLKAAWALFHQAGTHYQQTVITAFKEVEDALNNIEYYQLQLNDFHRAIVANGFIVKTTKNKQVKGLLNTFDVITTERALLNAELNETVMLENTYLATIQLIKSIGGRW